MGVSCAGYIAEGRASTKSLPNLPSVEALADYLSVCAMSTGQTREEVHAIAEREWHIRRQQLAND